MSSIVSQSYANTFGNQSPLKKIITESGVITSVSKNLLNVNSQIARKRMFDMFIKANVIFPNDTLEINEFIRSGIRDLISPFFKYNVERSVDSIDEIKREEYEMAELKCSTNFSRVMGVRNVTILIINGEKELSAEKHGISTYIDRSIETTKNTNGLEVKWSNGFFKFEDPASLNITIFIPREYIKHVMLNVQAISSKELAADVIPNLIFKDSCFEVFISDIIKSFFTAIYTDGYRIKALGDFMSIFGICENEGVLITSKASNTADDSNIITDLKTRYATIINSRFKGCRDVSIVRQVNELSKTRYANGINISPKDFYDLFVSIPYTEVFMLMNKIPALNRIVSDNYNTLKGDITFDNGISSIDTFMADEERDILPYTLKLMRYLPFVLYDGYIVGAGGEHGRIMQFITTANSIISSLSNFKTTNRIYNNMCEFIIANLNYMTTTMYTKLSSPQIVSTGMRRILTNLVSDETIY